jgi:hypothetical protein
VFLAKKMECVFSKKKLLGSNHLLQQTKQKQKLKAKVNTLQEKCVVHEAIKI